MDPSPTSMEAISSELAPMLAPRRIVGPTSLVFFFRVTYLSFVSTECGPRKTASSILQLLGMYTPVCIETRCPISHDPSMTTPVPITVSLPIRTFSRTIALCPNDTESPILTSEYIHVPDLMIQSRPTRSWRLPGTSWMFRPWLTESVSSDFGGKPRTTFGPMNEPAPILAGPYATVFGSILTL